MSDIVSRSLGFPEVQTGVVVFLSLLSLLLVGMSIYAIVSYFIAQMRQSLVVRIALGAQGWDILWLLARQGLLLCLVGAAVGAVAALAVARLLIHQIHLLQTRALPAVLLGAFLVTLLTFITSLAPTRRILGREPGTLLRYE
jgi:ABC-type antimicrobial peptide transport system permease subunit